MSLGFDPVGPYALTRWDLVVSSQIIAWRLARRWMKVYLTGLPILGLLSLLVAIFVGEYLPAAIIGGLLILWTLGPVLRWRKQYELVTLTFTEDGLRSDIAESAGVYKWSVVRPAQVIAERCFVPVGSALALVFPVSATSAENLNAVIATVDAMGQGGR